MTHDGKVWLVTGSSSGFGRLVTETEVLSDLSSKYSSSQLLTLKLDVTKSDEVKQAFSAAHAHFGRVDVVFNNAGKLVLGPVEGTPDDMARDLFELNLWGAVNVTSAAPAGGRLIQNSSVCGSRGLPASFAMEGISEALAVEVDPAWNIKVGVATTPPRHHLEPGSFYTGGHGRGDVAPAHPAYKQPDLSKMLKGEGMSDPIKGVEIIYRLGGHDGDKAKKLLAAAEEYASWSEALELNPRL
ncbi:uncharacterized protein B0H18DRAFT_1010702 [Fomitopsis serialis]|uniref:uncharacterized protein n=1 Tax=Fomitopsis serialis TaxID=139415 RepID=UPI0020080B0E|nr:uncharacterized protein B0H18DRAFT_1010702 [Neoantrodia serialis]KAH9924905.1 hypothetical protein B0H18DRAFT_1010702 [Neoantrodia serialis]